MLLETKNFFIMGLISLIRLSNMPELVPLRCQLLFLSSSGIILNQHPEILSGNDVMCKRESSLTLHFKLFSRKHVPDIVLTSASVEKTSTKDDMINELREACKELDYVIRVSSARSEFLKKMIKDLQKDSNLDDTVSSPVGKEVLVQPSQLVLMTLRLLDVSLNSLFLFWHLNVLDI